MSVETLFKSTHQSIKYIFRDGVTAYFIHGMYHTTNPKHIEELNAEVAAKHPHIFIDSKEKTIDTEKVDPISKLRDKLRAEILDEMARNSNPLNDFGSSNQGNLNPASTMDIAAVSAGGDGAQLVSRLQNLVGKATPV
jgi:hypothetical protein